MTSTVLSLLIVPVVFTDVDDFLVSAKRWIRLISSRQEVPALTPAGS
jgi:hypothetical protein